MRWPVLLLVAALAACAERSAEEPPATNDIDATALSAETREGPLAATVSLRPAQPRLGDVLVLTLSVTAEAGIAVDMPVFGDALGRFGIVDYAPRREVLEDGGLVLSQRYTLLSPMSGRQRIPRLRIEYTDERRATAAQPRELLTDELGFVVASVLPEGEVIGELRPARPALAELPRPWLQRHWPWLAFGAVLVALAATAVVAWLRRAEERARVTAYDRARVRLERLQGVGLPDAAAMDGWYVELSDIVRRYIEERFALRAPELTTEEFLLEAGRSADLSPPHRELLSDFLARCDRVKFARYSPGDDESREALDVAGRFLRETRVERAAATPGSHRRDAPQLEVASA